MKCRRVEKLIPLYVEGDLASRLADRLTSHLDWCGRCNWLADEYKESQGWLRSSETPEFDEAFLNAVKAGVLKRIEETGARPSLLASMIQQWSRRQVLALSAAMLIIFGVLVLYIHQARMSAKPQVVETVNRDGEKESAPPNEPIQTPDAKKAAGASFREPARASVPLLPGRRAVNPAASAQRFEPPIVSQINPLEQSGSGSADSTDGLAWSGDDSPGMLRIEIQTDDPNIRIIWFAPKEVESPNTNQ